MKTKSKGEPYKIACSRVTVARLSSYSHNIFFSNNNKKSSTIYFTFGMLIAGGSTHQTSRCVILLSRTRFKRIRHSVALRPSDISQSAMHYDVLINDLPYVYRQLNGGLLNVLWNFDVFVFTRIGETYLCLEQTRNNIENFEAREDQVYASCYDI